MFYPALAYATLEWTVQPARAVMVVMAVSAYSLAGGPAIFPRA